MNFLSYIFNVFFYRPLFNALILFYETIPGHDFGIAIILLTALIRLLLHPLMVSSLKSQKVLSALQVKIKEIQEKFKNDKERQTKETIELYRKEKINPLSGFLLLFVQLPILFALYRVFWQGFQPEAMVSLYSFIPHPGKINPNFLGLINLSQSSVALAILAGISQFFQAKTTPQQVSGQGQFAEIFQKEMLYFFPVFTTLILLKLGLPSAIALYWLVTNLFAILQQVLVFKKYAK